MIARADPVFSESLPAKKCRFTSQVAEKKQRILRSKSKIKEDNIRSLSLPAFPAYIYSLLLKWFP